MQGQNSEPKKDTFLRNLIIIIFFLAIINYVYFKTTGRQLYLEFLDLLKSSAKPNTPTPTQQLQYGEIMNPADWWKNDNFPLRMGSMGDRVRKLYSFMQDKYNIPIYKGMNTSLFNYSLDGWMKEYHSKDSISEQEFYELGIDQYPPMPNT